MNSKPADLANIFRLDQEGRLGGKGATHGWQVRIIRDNKPHSAFFSDKKYKSRELGLDEAIKYRDKLYGELGFSYQGGIPIINDKLGANNNSGILGVNRTESLMDSTNIYEAWQTTYPRPDGGYDCRKFSITKYSEMTALRKAINQRLEGISALIGATKYNACQDQIKRLVDKYLNIIIYLENITPSEEAYISKIINDKSTPNTTKEEIVNNRIGQATFRDKLIKLWGNSCQVTGATILINASHIKPWAVATPEERLDPFNGFLLSPVFDRAFDQGHLSFLDGGEAIFSNSFMINKKAFEVPENPKIKIISPFGFNYLSYHRSYIFKQNQ